MVGGEYYLTISAPASYGLGEKILRREDFEVKSHSINEKINYSISDKGVCNTAPAILGLLINKAYIC